MNYNSMTKDQLIELIEELKLLNDQLLKEKEQETRLDYSWSGNLGHWYWNIKSNTVVFNPLKVITLGYSKEEIPEKVSYQFFTDKLHPEDYRRTMDAMMSHLNGEAKVYETEYRIRTKSGSYKWYYDRGCITQYDEVGKPLFLAGIVFDITEKKELQLKLEQKNKILAEQSSIDGLTKINNHRTLIEFLRSSIAESNFNKSPLSIALFDIDDFKNVNDTKGHIFGDRVLTDVAAIIQRNIRDHDLAGRYGGEEFMIILPNTKLDEAAVVSERIRTAIERNKFTEDLSITISGGVKEYSGQELSDLIHLADINLYEAKKSGKNRIVY